MVLRIPPVLQYIYIYVYIYTYMYVCIYIYTYIYIYICAHTCAHICVYVFAIINAYYVYDIISVGGGMAGREKSSRRSRLGFSRVKCLELVAQP